MTNQISDAFVEAGFEKHARTLSIMYKARRKKFSNRKDVAEKVGPAIGHHIAILDNILELDKIMSNRPDNFERTKYFNNSANHVLEWAAQYTTGLHDKIKDILYHGKVNNSK